MLCPKGSTLVKRENQLLVDLALLVSSVLLFKTQLNTFSASTDCVDSALSHSRLTNSLEST